MQRTPRLLALLISTALIAAPVFAAEEKAAAEPAKAEAVRPITVNGVTIPVSVIDSVLKSQFARGAPDTPEFRKQITDNLINQQLLVQQAKSTGVDKQPEVAAQAEIAQQSVLANAFVNDYLKKHPVTDEAVKEQYEKFKAAISGDEFKSRHILVEKEEDAKSIVEKLGKGEKFDELAKQNSKDPGSKDSGGELGWSMATAYVPPFAEALKKLKKGEYTKEPVKTDFGYHIIELEDIRPVTPPPLDQVKPQLEQVAKRDVVENLLKDLKQKAKITE